MSTVKSDARPLIAHVLHRFDTGGLENGVVNLINRLPGERFRHAIVALTEITEFRRRIERDDVQFIALNKPPGQGLWTFPRMRTVLRELQPAIVHTRNLGALEMAAPAAWAGVPVRIHGEHGWDINDPDGRSVKFRLTRRLYRPFVHQYIALSQQLERYLLDGVGVASERVVQLYNGVDTRRFRPSAGSRPPIDGLPFTGDDLWLVGTVGRLSPIKDQVLLARAFVRALEWAPQAKAHLRLVLAGSGPLPATSSACCPTPASESSPGCPATAATCPTSCAGSTPSRCRPSPRASPTPSWRRWPAACRSSPPASAATSNCSRRA
jgi:sugar transferase (PEP-CTERM/EpsH1 system associated)